MTKKNDKKSFVFYNSFLEAMKHLNDSEFRECVMRIRDYALEDIDEESASPNINIIMALAKPNLDSARRRYMASVENGKKGAEFGKLGGAPKGNQNARKKQPLNQPLDVDVDDNVEEDVNEDEKVDVNGDAPLGTTGSHSSFSNSSIGFVEEIENDSERLEEREEKREPLEEVNQYNSNDCSDSSASEETSKAPLYSKEDEIVSPTTTEPKANNVDAATRHQQKEEGGMSMSEYVERVIANNIARLANMKHQGKELDKTILNSTIDNIIALYGVHDRKSAYKIIMEGMEAMIANNLLL